MALLVLIGVISDLKKGKCYVPAGRAGGRMRLITKEGNPCFFWFKVILHIILVISLLGMPFLIKKGLIEESQGYGETPQPNVNMMPPIPPEPVLNPFSDDNRTAPGQTQIKVVPASED